MFIEHLDLTTVLLAAVVFLLTLTLLTLFGPSKYKNLPPGPQGLPLFGHLLLLIKQDKVFLKFTELAKIYGKVVRLRLGLHDAFILNGYDVMKEAMIDKADVFSERPRWIPSVKETHRDKGGIFFHESWRERRRFTLVSMKDFGLGKQSLEDRMVEEASFLNQELEKSKGKPIDPSVLLPVTTSNIICSIISGKRFEYGDSNFLHFNRCINTLVKYTGGASIGNFIPYLGFIKFEQEHVKKEAYFGLMEMCTKWKKEHKQTLDPNNTQDLIDLFLVENKSKDSKASDADLANLILELFLAGTDTTSTTLCWALLYLIHNQTIQDKCRNEIKEAIGMERAPIFADNKNTPYINAVIHETQRMGNIVPMSLQHCAAVDAELAGYTIPAGSIVRMNMHTALRDPKYWVDPDKFNPDRWIDEDGNAVRNPAFIPFSTGKRACLGEQLAKKELYIFLTSMLQKFKFSIVDEHNPPEIDGTGNAIHRPKPYKLIASKL